MNAHHKIKDGVDLVALEGGRVVACLSPSSQCCLLRALGSFLLRQTRSTSRTTLESTLSTKGDSMRIFLIRHEGIMPMRSGISQDKTI